MTGESSFPPVESETAIGGHNGAALTITKVPEVQELSEVLLTTTE